MTTNKNEKEPRNGSSSPVDRTTVSNTYYSVNQTSDDVNELSDTSKPSAPSQVPFYLSPFVGATLMLIGWILTALGQFKSGNKIKNKEGFQLYIRSRKIADVIDDFSKKSSNGTPANPHEQGVSSAGSNPPLNILEGGMTPNPATDNNTIYENDNILVQYSADNGSVAAQTPATSSVQSTGQGSAARSVQVSATGLPVLSSLRDYPSLAALRQDKPCLVIGVDSEWQSAPVRTDMISWQFALIHDGELKEYLFLREKNKNLALEDVLGIILDKLNICKPVDIRKVRRYKYCVGWTSDDKPIVCVTDDVQEAIQDAIHVYRPELGFTKELIDDMPDKNVKRNARDWAWFHRYLDFSEVDKIKITVLCCNPAN